MRLCSNNIEEVLGSILLRIMLVFMAIMPFGYSFFQIAETMYSCWDRNGILYIITLSIVIIIGILTVSRSIPKSINKKEKIIMLVLLFGVAFFSRTIVSVLLQTTPTSDFGRCFRYALSETTNEEELWMVRFPYLGAYAVTLKLFFQVFPNTLFSAQVMNALSASCTTVLLFIATEKMTSNSRTALIAGTIYACYPGLIVYSAIPSCEHFSQLFFALGLCFLVYEKITSWQAKIIKGALIGATGVALGLMCLYKELFIIAVPALLMASFCYEILPEIAKKLKGHKKESGIYREILKDIVLVAVILCVYKASVLAVQIEISGTPFDRNDPISVPIYRGLAIEAGGKWNEAVNDVCDQVRREYKTNGEVNRVLFEKLRSEYQGDVGKLWNVILGKMQTDFCDEGVYWYWTFNEDGNNLLQRTWVGELLFSLFPSAFFMIMCGIMAVGLFLLALKKNIGNSTEFYISGVVFLFVILLMLMEAQGRYKSNIMPYICILFSLASESLSKTMDVIIVKTK